MTSAEPAPDSTPAVDRDGASADGGHAAATPEGAAGRAPAGPRPPSGTVPRGGGGGVLDFDDPLDRVSADDSDRGWGETYSAADDDFTRFLNEKPPHHL